MVQEQNYQPVKEHTMNTINFADIDFYNVEQVKALLADGLIHTDDVPYDVRVEIASNEELLNMLVEAAQHAQNLRQGSVQAMSAMESIGIIKLELMNRMERDHG